MSSRSPVEVPPLLTHRILEYERMTVGPEWVFRNKVDPYDKLLYVFDGWVELGEQFARVPQLRRLSAGSVALIPAHIPMDYAGSAVLDKMHLYFSLEYLEMPLPLEELGRCFYSSFDAVDLANALVEADASILSQMQLKSLVGYHLSRVLRPADDRLRQWATRLERYAALEKLVSSGPVFRIRVADLANTLGMGESTLSRNFRRDTGQTLKGYLKEQVIRRSKRALNGPSSIKEVAADLGFDDEFYFSKYFKRETGFSPRAYRDSLAEKLE